IERQRSAKENEGQHPSSQSPRRFDLVDAQRQQERQQALRVEHISRARVMRDPPGQPPIQPHPHKSFDELVRGKQAWHGGQQYFAAVLHLAQRRHANCAQYRTAHKVRRRGKAHCVLRLYPACITCSVTQSVRTASWTGQSSGAPSSTALTKFSTIG